MKIRKISPEKVPQLSKRDRDYWLGKEALQSLLPWPFNTDHLQDIVNARKQYPTNRQLLHDTIRAQYKSKHLPKGIEENIHALLHEDTFTVCTAHQPVLFTGPLYFIYKIVSTIALAKLWEKQCPQHRIVPVFILGAEDHDFEEIACAHLREHDICWETTAGGPVGQLSTESLKKQLTQLKQILNEHPFAYKIEQIFKKNKNYGQAMAELVDELFSPYGLLVLQLDSADLKRSFIPQFWEELTQRPSKPLIEHVQRKLKQLGYKAQAHAREINIFYMTKHARQLILPKGEGFQIRDSGLYFSREEMKQELEKHPQRFSPNVSMRPLFQEHVLPNLAYVGGGGELAYWMERPKQFQHFGIPFPMLVRRNSALMLSPHNMHIIQKIGISEEELFQEPQKVIDQKILNSSNASINICKEKSEIMRAFRQIEEKAANIDPTLRAAVRARAKHSQKEIEKLEKKMLKAERQKQEHLLIKLQKLHEMLFPQGMLQERYENFLPYFTEYGRPMLDSLVEQFNPFDKRFYLLELNSIKS